MYHFIRPIHLVIALGLFVFPMGTLTSVYAKGTPKPLKGTYHFLGQATCAGDSMGLDATGNAFSREMGGGTVTFVQHGEVTYNKDGTGTFTGQVLGVVHPATGIGQFPINQATLNCTVTNTLNPDGTFTDVWQCTTTPTAGPKFVNNFTDEFPINFQGVIGDKKRKELHYFNTQTIEEVVTVKNSGGGVENTLERICNRLAKGFKREGFKKNDDDDD